MTDKAKDLSNFVPDPRKSPGGVAIADEAGQSLVIRVAGGGENNKAKTIVDVLRNVERWMIAYMGAGFCAVQPSERNSEANTKGKYGDMDVNGVRERRYFTGGGRPPVLLALPRRCRTARNDPLAATAGLPAA